MDKNDHIYQAIDKGGGQSCDVEGVVRELKAAGYIIVKKQDYDDAIRGITRLASGGYLLPTNWPR